MKTSTKLILPFAVFGILLIAQSASAWTWSNIKLSTGSNGGSGTVLEQVSDKQYRLPTGHTVAKSFYFSAYIIGDADVKGSNIESFKHQVQVKIDGDWHGPYSGSCNNGTTKNSTINKWIENLSMKKGQHTIVVQKRTVYYDDKNCQDEKDWSPGNWLPKENYDFNILAALDDGQDQKYTLTVSKSGNGTIKSNPTGINCGTNCTQNYTNGTNVDLTATASTNYTFTGWSGACSGTGTCTVVMNSAQSVSANFTYNSGNSSYRTLNVYYTGSGSISSSPSGIDCGSDCSKSYSNGSVVYLYANPSSNYYFSGWSGACSGTGTCQVTLNSDQSVTANFTYNGSSSSNYTLNVYYTGSGSVSSSPSGIDCDSDCSQSYSSGSVVYLYAYPNSNYYFSGWSGACSGTGTCSVTMNSNQSVTASFTYNGGSSSNTYYTLNITKNGNGTITSSPSGISCGSDCVEWYLYSYYVTLTASPNSNESFSGWSGDCSGTASTCTVYMNGYKNVTANFTTNGSSGSSGYYDLEVSVSGKGSVTSDPSGINCGSDCFETYSSNSYIMLTATPNSGYSFSGWSGCDSTNSNTCYVVADSDQFVYAFFSKNSTTYYYYYSTPTTTTTISTSSGEASIKSPSNVSYYKSTDGTSAILTWSDVSSNESSYKIFYWDDTLENWKVYSVLPPDSVSATVTIGTESKIWGISACSGDVCSEKSAIKIESGSQKGTSFFSGLASLLGIGDAGNYRGLATLLLVLLLIAIAFSIYMVSKYYQINRIR